VMSLFSKGEYDHASDGTGFQALKRVKGGD